jgi:hypothetical protein
VNRWHIFCKLFSNTKAMDNKTKKRPQDSLRINMNEEYEVQYWIEKFNCTKEQLKNAVDRVGVMARDVEAYLKDNRN